VQCSNCTKIFSCVQDPQGQFNVIHIIDSFDFRSHLCICFELMSHSLYDFMRYHDFQGLNMQLVHKFAVQLLNTLCFLRSEGIIHCDLKPENILLQNSNYSNLKVGARMLARYCCVSSVCAFLGSFIGFRSASLQAENL
jgi:serine/threonine protein kinase